MNPIIDKTTTGVAAGAVFSPWWLPTLADVSQISAQLLPIIGLLWLLIQIVHWIVKRK